MYKHTTSGLVLATHAEIRAHCAASLPVDLTNEVLAEQGYIELPPEAGPLLPAVQLIGPAYPQPTPATGAIGVTIYEST